MSDDAELVREQLGLGPRSVGHDAARARDAVDREVGGELVAARPADPEARGRRGRDLERGARDEPLEPLARDGDELRLDLAIARADPEQ